MWFHDISYLFIIVVRHCKACKGSEERTVLLQPEKIIVEEEDRCGDLARVTTSVSSDPSYRG